MPANLLQRNYPADWNIVYNGSAYDARNMVTGESILNDTIDNINTYIANRQNARAGVVMNDVVWGNHHTTRFDFTNLSFNATTAITTAKAFGVQLFNFPSGEIMVEAASINVFVTSLAGNAGVATAVGLGTTVGTGASASLSGTMQNILNPVTTVVADGATKKVTTAFTPSVAAAVPLLIATGSAHTMFLNVAGTWAVVSAATDNMATGSVVLNWRNMS